MTVDISTRDEGAPAPDTGNGEKLSWWTKIGYGLGDIYGGGSFLLISFYYLFFLTDVIRLDPGLAGTVILISKVYDSITDPLEGIIADRTRTKMGRRRPYLLAGIIFVFLSFFALFFPVSFESQIARFAFVLLTYLFFSTVVSIVMLNYNALQSELTLDYDERTSLSSVRIFFSVVSSILAALLPLEIVKMFPDERTGYIAMGIFFGLFFALPFIAVVAATRERPEFQQEPQPFSWKMTFIEPARVRSFVFLLMMYLFAFGAIDIVSSLVVFYMKYYLMRGGEASFVSGTLLVTQVFALPFYVWLAQRFSKRVGFITGTGFWFVIMFFSLLLSPDQPNWVIYVFAALVGAGTGGVVISVYAMLPDIPDVDELVSGERREGMYSAMTTFMRKFSGAIALFLVGQALSIFGYVTPIAQVVDGVQTSIEQPQTDSFLLFLRLMFAIVPPVALAVAIYFASRYPLSHEAHARLRAVLGKKRVGEPLTEAEQAEEADLRKLLVGHE